MLRPRAEVVQAARNRLISLFDKTLAEASINPADTILSISTYDRSRLRAFLAQAHRSAALRYEQYLHRRERGCPREMFPTGEYAREWLRLAGVVKYVDGSWIGGILGIGTGRTAALGEGKIGNNNGSLERMVSKMAWQVISEEFGDGDIQKNHVFLYEKLLKQLGHARAGNEATFDDLPEDEGVPRCWEAAVAQQCIGLLASTRDHFPEALGFNMAYEALPYHLLVTARELQELRIDNYYFAIHITIDNADSGHSAMARLAVERYLEGVLQRDGPEAMESVWRRVQAGFTLAEGLPTTPASPIEFEQVPSSSIDEHQWLPKVQSVDATPIELKLVDVIVKKSLAADKMHCTSRMQIAGSTVEEWLDPNTLTKEKTLAFVRALATKRPFVIPGEPPRSRFMRDLEWGGRMFGAFSRSECTVVGDWIRSLKPNVCCQGAYEAYVDSQPPERASDIITGAVSSFEWGAIDLWDTSILLKKPLESSVRNSSTASPDFERLRPLWYVATSLFDCFPLQPSKFASPLGMVILRLIRSQQGFGALHRIEDICAGTDDFGFGSSDQDTLGLWELGAKLDAVCGRAPPVDIVQLAAETRDPEMDDFCARLLAYRSRPYANAERLLGIYSAVCEDLYTLPSVTDLLPEQSDKTALRRMIDEQRSAIADYLGEVSGGRSEDFEEGYRWAKNTLSVA
ncbi:hypothetical protein I316_06378 [Kwoniella heveanensis BCC8398]|uniref:Uncharacterized protein n=1 Tax=Kwoniella heveanensis BCC8398 TaxID=1296120 RepID=A0A1B9GLU5_9TREE|nr:hypothetical protein I316_06378 [Kwoniella heveanensis BCC8398]